MSVKRTKGMAITTEVLIIGLATLIILAFAYRYAASFMVNPTMSQTNLEGRLCGYVVMLTNNGRLPASITDAYTLYSDGTSIVFVHLIGVTINPGETRTFLIPTTSRVPNRVVVVGQNFPTVTLVNECA